MNKIEELESRVEELECEVRQLKKLLAISEPEKPQSLASLYNAMKSPVTTPIPFGGEESKVLIKKPIMYLYNFSGDTLNCNIDFKNNVIADSVPEIRKDNKLIFSLDSDSFINDKYSYLYYEFEIVGTEPKSPSYAFVKNNKMLDYDLERLAKMLGFVYNEVADFVTFWSLELKRMESPFFKCEIFDESKLDKLFPIEISPTPKFLARRYVKFVPVDKLGKSNITPEQFRTPNRMGELRVFEWGGWITGSKTVK